MDLAQSIQTDTLRTGPQAYEILSKTGVPALVGHFSIQTGWNSRWDAGATIFSSIGGGGFKLFAKYNIMNRDNKWAMAFMPVIGYAWPWSNKDSSATYSGRSVVFDYSTLIDECIWPISYHFSRHTALIITPKLLFQINTVSQTGSAKVNYSYTKGHTVFLPAISIGIQTELMALEGTVLINDGTFRPMLGFTYSLNLGK